MTTRLDMPLDEAVAEALHGTKNVVRCPAHDDDSPSLSVGPGQRQPVVLHCHAGCEQDAIIEAGGLDWATVCAPLDLPERRGSRKWTPVGDASNVYPYRAVDGTLLFEVLRVPVDGGKKRIMQRRPDETAASGYVWSLDDVQRVLYRLPEVIAAVRAGMTIHVVEGEKCVEALQPLLPEGEVATTNPGGAGKWLDDYDTFIAGANVVIYSDSDDAGRAHSRQVRDHALRAGATVAVKEAPPGVLPNGKAINDVADHIEAGLSLDLLLETTPETEDEKARTGVDVLDLIHRPMSRVEFAIDGTLAQGERLILLGFEGTGKSTLCRQIACMVAAGLHPFTGMPLKEPRRVLFIDAENHPDQVQESWGQLVGLAGRHGHEVERGMLTVMEEWETTRDLTSEGGTAWLTERVHAYKPHLVVMGPLTNLAARDLRDDEPVRRIRNAVNEARTICNSAWVMEHHAPLKGPMDKERALRPYGSSLFLKWPDYGYGIKPTEDEKVFEWHKNRGPRVRSRQWPMALREGEPNTMEWPWMEAFLPDAPEPRR